MSKLEQSFAYGKITIEVVTTCVGEVMTEDEILEFVTATVQQHVLPQIGSIVEDKGHSHVEQAQTYTDSDCRATVSIRLELDYATNEDNLRCALATATQIFHEIPTMVKKGMPATTGFEFGSLFDGNRLFGVDVGDLPRSFLSDLLDGNSKPTPLIDLLTGELLKLFKFNEPRG